MMTRGFFAVLASLMLMTLPARADVIGKVMGPLAGQPGYYLVQLDVPGAWESAHGVPIRVVVNRGGVGVVAQVTRVGGQVWLVLPPSGTMLARGDLVGPDPRAALAWSIGPGGVVEVQNPETLEAVPIPGPAIPAVYNSASRPQASSQSNRVQSLRSRESRLGEGGPRQTTKDDPWGYGPGATRRTLQAGSNR
ncbi:MAG: hypothetical protein HY319_16815 [Armatimonadetes bacterium]|nr:hypothetical protein [Armatimonadota bacterium]